MEKKTPLRRRHNGILFQGIYSGKGPQAQAAGMERIWFLTNQNPGRSKCHSPQSCFTMYSPL